MTLHLGSCVPCCITPYTDRYTPYTDRLFPLRTPLGTAGTLVKSCTTPYSLVKLYQKE